MKEKQIRAKACYKIHFFKQPSINLQKCQPENKIQIVCVVFSPSVFKGAWKHAG